MYECEEGIYTFATYSDLPKVLDYLPREQAAYPRWRWWIKDKWMPFRRPLGLFS